MRWISAAIMLSAAFLGPRPALAKGAGRPQPPRDDIRDEVEIARLMDRLREEMWAYRQE